MTNPEHPRDGKAKRYLTAFALRNLPARAQFLALLGACEMSRADYAHAMAEAHGWGVQATRTRIDRLLAGERTEQPIRDAIAADFGIPAELWDRASEETK